MDLQMGKKLQLPNSVEKKGSTGIHLHANMQYVLFENRKFMKAVIDDIKGLHEVHHFSLTFIDPLNQLMTFSSAPNIEYNLITQDLWELDPGFRKAATASDPIIWWDELPRSAKNHRISKIRLTNNRYTLGFSISRAIGDFSIGYSFATCSPKNMKEDYLSYMNQLIRIGDYCYKSIREMYLQYCKQVTPPKLQAVISNIYCDNSKSLKLIVTE
jgi:hypothetical protein